MRRRRAGNPGTAQRRTKRSLRSDRGRGHNADHSGRCSRGRTAISSRQPAGPLAGAAKPRRTCAQRAAQASQPAARNAVRLLRVAQDRDSLTFWVWARRTLPLRFWLLQFSNIMHLVLPIRRVPHPGDWAGQMSSVDSVKRGAQRRVFRSKWGSPMRLSSSTI
jgi:hypothetical protein